MALDTFQAQLSSYRDATLAGLLSAVPQREPQRHLYAPLSSYLSRTGKGIRPALCLATCRAFGGDASEALASATAIEMLHNAFLVHDDIEDESDLRRGLPTMHAEHGVPIATTFGALSEPYWREAEAVETAPADAPASLGAAVQRLLDRDRNARARASARRLYNERFDPVVAFAPLFAD